MNYATENDLLFDDVALLEKRLGAGALNITAVNANCDCDGYSSTSTNKDSDPNQITPIARTTA